MSLLALAGSGGPGGGKQRRLSRSLLCWEWNARQQLVFSGLPGWERESQQGAASVS